jgi:hypothetical protein
VREPGEAVRPRGPGNPLPGCRRAETTPPRPARHGSRSYDPILGAGPGPEQMDWFRNALDEMGQGYRPDFTTFVDLQDLEEERL